MAQRKANPSEESFPMHRAATTPEGRENQLIGLAVDLAEEQMRAGTASSQVMSHFLKLGSSREKLEQERISMENGLLAAKREALEAAGRIEELYATALNAMRNYQGVDTPQDDYDN